MARQGLASGRRRKIKLFAMESNGTAPGSGNRLQQSTWTMAEPTFSACTAGKRFSSPDS